MLSYILNRQYQKITQCLPESLQGDQPDTVYLRSYANPTLKQSTLAQIKTTDIKKTNKLNLKKKTKLPESTFIGDCCPTCYSNQNISVKYYNKRHICVNCRKFLRDQHGNQVKIFLNKQGDIVCLGIYNINKDPIQKETQEQQNDKKQANQQKISSNAKALKMINHKVYYHTDHMKLNWNGKSAFVTFAAQDQMIALLRDAQ